MKRALASLIIVGVPLAASAQTSPQGITVTGNGSASAVVSSAIVRVSMNRFAGDDGSYIWSRVSKRPAWQMQRRNRQWRAVLS